MLENAGEAIVMTENAEEAMTENARQTISMTTNTGTGNSFPTAVVLLMKFM